MPGAYAQSNSQWQVVPINPMSNSNLIPEIYDGKYSTLADTNNDGVLEGSTVTWTQMAQWWRPLVTDGQTYSKGLKAWAQSKGKLRSLFRYSGPDPVPPVLVIEVTTSASAMAGANYGSDWGSDSYDSTTNFRGTETVIANADGKTPQGEPPRVNGGRDKHSSIQNKRLVFVETNGQRDVYSPWIELHAEAEIPTGRIIQQTGPSGTVDVKLLGQVQITHGYSPAVANRYVYITSGMEDSYYRKDTDTCDMIGPIFERAKIERGADGSMTVHSVMELVPTVSTYLWQSSVTCKANYSGYSNPGFIWGLTKGPRESYTQRGSEVDLYYDFGDAGEKGAIPPSSSERNLTVTVNENSQPGNNTTSNTYKMVWHAPYENWHEYQTDEDPFLTVIKPIGVDPEQTDAGHDITVTRRSVPFWMSAMYYVGQVGLTFAVPELSPIQQFAFASIGFLASELKPTPVTDEIPDNLADWDQAAEATRNGVEQRIYPANLANATGPQRETVWGTCTWEFEERTKYKHHYYWGDEYDRHGYRARVLCYIKEPTTRFPVHIYHQATQPPTPPPGPTPTP